MTTENVEITRHNNGDNGEYHADVEGSNAKGRLTWTKRSDGARVAEHTLVPKSIGGRGIAGLLVKDMVADARENDFKIVAQCSYVEAKFDEHPEWADLLA